MRMPHLLCRISPKVLLKELGETKARCKWTTEFDIMHRSYSFDEYLLVRLSVAESLLSALSP